MTGRVIAQRFHAEGPSASGSMGTVYRARDEHTGVHVALKTMRPTSRQTVDRFLREARTLALLSHPSIVAIDDFGEAAGLCWFMMEYVDGIDLRRALREGGVTPRQVDAQQEAPL